MQFNNNVDYGLGLVHEDMIDEVLNSKNPKVVNKDFQAKLAKWQRLSRNEPLKAADNENENVTSTKTLTEYPEDLVKNYLKYHATNLLEFFKNDDAGASKITPPEKSNLKINEQPIKKPTNEIKNMKYWQEKYSSFLRDCTSWDANNILTLLSFLHPNDLQTAVVNEFFNKINPLLKKLFPFPLSKRFLVSIHEQVDVFEILEKHSMCQRRKVEDKDLISVDPSLQEVIRKKLEEEEEKLVEMLEKLLHIYIHKMFQADEVSWTDLLQFQTFWKHAAKIKQLVEKYDYVPNWIARKCENAERYKEGFNFCCGAFKNLQSHLGMKHRSTLEIMHWKGIFHKCLEEYDDALRIQMEVYEKQKSLFGEADEDTLQTAKQIGFVYWRRKNLQEAKKWLGEAVKTSERFGKSKITTLDLKNSLAGVLEDEGKYKEAEHLLQEILPLYEDIRGREHSVILAMKLNIAASKERQGNYHEALTVYREVLETQKKVLGKQHPLALLTKQCIERTKSKQKK